MCGPRVITENTVEGGRPRSKRFSFIYIMHTQAIKLIDVEHTYTHAHKAPLYYIAMSASDRHKIYKLWIKDSIFDLKIFRLLGTFLIPLLKSDFQRIPLANIKNNPLKKYDTHTQMQANLFTYYWILHTLPHIYIRMYVHT